MDGGEKYLEGIELQEEILRIFEELIGEQTRDSSGKGIPEFAAPPGILPRLGGYLQRVCSSPRHRG